MNGEIKVKRPDDGSIITVTRKLFDAVLAARGWQRVAGEMKRVEDKPKEDKNAAA